MTVLGVAGRAMCRQVGMRVGLNAHLRDPSVPFAPLARDERFVSCHYPSAVVTSLAPSEAEEHVAVFRFIASAL